MTITVESAFYNTPNMNTYIIIIHYGNDYYINS